MYKNKIQQKHEKRSSDRQNKKVSATERWLFGVIDWGKNPPPAPAYSQNPESQYPD